MPVDIKFDVTYRRFVDGCQLIEEALRTRVAMRAREVNAPK